MVVGDFHVERVTILPHKAHPELIVDSDTVLSFTITGKLFEPVAGRNPQILQLRGRMELLQFPLGYISQIRRRHPFALAGVPELFRVLVRERLDHESEFNAYR